MDFYVFFLNLIVFLFGGKPDVCEREHGSIAEPFRLNSAQKIAKKRR